MGYNLISNFSFEKYNNNVPPVTSNFDDILFNNVV